MGTRIMAPDTTRIERYANLRGPAQRLRRWWFTAKTPVIAAVVTMSLLFAAGTIAWSYANQVPDVLYGYSGAPGRPGVMITNLPVELVPSSSLGTAKVPVLTIRTGAEVVTTSGQKCSHADVPIPTTVSKQWVEVQPPGYVAQAPVADPVVRPAGICAQVVLDHQIPDGVLARVREQAANGENDTVWKIQAKETPDHRDSTSARWESIGFVIDYQGAT